ncbi:MAG: hypothetical protein IJ614_08390, partial [Prevotella sp.]|nr:hypothetical protein [Prevotella sp.]
MGELTQNDRKIKAKRGGTKKFKNEGNPLDSFTLELPKGDTAFLKTIARKMGWTVRSNRRKMSSYERSLRDLDE